MTTDRLLPPLWRRRTSWWMGILYSYPLQTVIWKHFGKSTEV